MVVEGGNESDGRECGWRKRKRLQMVADGCRWREGNRLEGNVNGREYG